MTGTFDEVDGKLGTEQLAICARRRMLLREGTPVNIGSRAFDILMVLIEAEGKLVTKSELLKKVWPTTIVEEHNIEVQISSIRKALGKWSDVIRTEPGRGYRLTARFGRQGAAKQSAQIVPIPEQAAVHLNTTLPLSLSHLIGRDEDVWRVKHLVSSERLVTITGSGGIGKTRLAVEVARSLLPDFAGRVSVVDLSAVSTVEQMQEQIARADFTGQFTNGAQGLELLLLDNCEHVLDLAAPLVEGLVKRNSKLHVLATSRECLAAEGERLFPLQPLEAPTEDLSDAVQALKYSAVALFVDRARAIEPQFNVDPDAAVDLGRICRRLNGVPLAIEIAAASVSVVGLRELANRLSSGFEHVRNQRRTSAERHRTLRAVFSWSYDLLAEDAKALLRRLAIIPTSFTLEEAGAVAIGGPVDDLVTLVKLIEDLHRKSLIVVDMRTAPPRYKLLETTRAFAFERLLESEISAAFAGLCRHFLSVVRSDRRLSAAATLSDIRANYVSDVENIRAAIEWAFQQPQTAQFGIELTLSTTPIWLALSAFEECVLHCGRALSWLKRLHGDHHTEKLKLSITSCIAQMWVQGPRSELVKTLRAMVEAAENTSDEESRLRASYGVWLFHLRTGKYREALDLAERFVGVTNATDSAAWLTGQRMMAVSEHYVGHHSQARKRLDVLLRNAASGFLHAEYVLRFGVDQHIAALAAQVRVLFVQGYGHDARHLLDKSLAEAQKLGHVNSLCLLLAEAACVISMLVDDLQATAHFAAQLFQVAEKHGLGLWRRHALAFQTWVQAKTGDPAEGVEILLAAVRDWGPDYRQAIFAGELAKMLASLDRISESRAIIANAVDLADSGQWCIPELIRIGAEVECAAGALDLAEEKLNVALKLARRRGQRLWELKSAISLAQLLANRGDCKDVRRILLPVVESNAGEIEGLELRTARRILDAIVD